MKTISKYYCAFVGFGNFCPRDATFMHQCCNCILPNCYHVIYKTYELLSIILCVIQFGKRNTFILVIRIKQWAHWCNGNVIYLYFGVAQFECLPGHFVWQVFHGFPQTIKASMRIVPVSGHLIFSLFIYIYHLSILLLLDTV
jgi:hypothetical protein